MSNFGSDVLNDSTHLAGTWEYDGQEFALRVKDISYGDWQLVMQYLSIAHGLGTGQASATDAEALDDVSFADACEADDITAQLIEYCLVQPECDPQTTDHSKVQSLLSGMLAAWQTSQPVDDAMDKLPVDEGNE